MKFSGKTWLIITLKVTKKNRFHSLSRKIFFELTVVAGSNRPPSHALTILTNQVTWNGKRLTSHISKSMLWKGEPSDYISREGKYWLNSVVYCSVELTKILFFKGYNNESLTRDDKSCPVYP